ncbi:MAG: AraC family transcriptional regulator, partial [Cyanobacteria bacterium P01_A01_bin.83]
SSKEDWNGIYLRYDRQPTFEIQQHSHPQHTLIIGTENSLNAEWSIDGQFHDLQYGVGGLFLVPANAPHQAYWKQESEGILIALDPEKMIDAAIDSVDSDRIELIPQFATTDLKLLQMARWLLVELREKQIGSHLFAESLKTSLIVHLLRNYCTIKPKISEYKGGLAQHKLQIVIAFIEENLDLDFKLADLASLVAISPYHFARMFKQSTGLTPHQYLVKQRLDKAQELLRYSKLAIADIGYSVGYKNASHFTKVFRKHLGTTPKAYRNLI